MSEEEEESLDGPTFSPPVYQQRYNSVVQLINKDGCKKVFDIGCSEGKLLTRIKHNCPNVEMLFGLDIDEEVLCENRFRTRPLMAEYLMKRNKPFKMALYQGSVAEPDPSFIGFDFISCIEVIEHLPKENLDAFPAAIFGILRPRVLVVTTPNADFNVLFPVLTGFRHPDHKFEWTKQEFVSWCKHCSEMYGYTVSFSFIGYGPEGTEHLGGCSQMAVFTKVLQHVLDESLVKDVVFGAFTVISEDVYPYETPKNMEESLRDEITYLVGRYTNIDHDDLQIDGVFCKAVPVKSVLGSPSVKRICKDEIIVRNTISELFTLSKDQTCILLPLEDESDDPFDNDQGYFDGDCLDCGAERGKGEEGNLEGNRVDFSILEEYWD